MGIITITSDLGTTDHYLAVIKGQLLCQIPDATIIDVTNEIVKFNIIQAAYTVKNTIDNFPKGTVHLVLVGIPNEETDFVIVNHKGQFYIGQDNGVFSLVFEHEPILGYKINLSPPPELFSFPEKFIFPQAASHLLRGGVPEVIGEVIQQLRPGMNYAPIIQDTLIKAMVQHIDSYGNVITNLHKKDFIKAQKGRAFEIEFRAQKFKLSKISQQYSEVDQVEPVALFNSSGFLEIAINSGRASSLLGLKVNDSFPIYFS